MAIDISITDPPYSAKITDGVDDSEVWQQAFDDLAANGGGRIRFNKPGESWVRKTITIPVERNIPIVFEGLGPRICSIRGQGLASDAPVFQWDNNQNHAVEDFCWHGMAIRHKNGGPVVQHKSTGRRFKNCILTDLLLSQEAIDGGSSVTLDIEGVLHSTFRDITLIGGSNAGTGFRIRGSHAFLEDIYAPIKRHAPSQFLDFECSSSTLCHLRTEGGNSVIADYWIHDCVLVDVRNVHSEGHLSQDIMRIENCEGITLTAVGIANQPKGKVNEPVGLRFVNSRFCTLNGCAIGARVDSGGYALVFDKQSNHNTLLSTRIVKTNFTNDPEQILDQGTGNRWSIVEKSDSSHGTYFIMPY